MKSKTFSLIALLVLIITGCSNSNPSAQKSKISERFTNLKDYSDFEDFKKWGFSLAKEINESGSWSYGTKLIVSHPRECWDTYDDGKRCSFAAIINDVRGTQGCTGLWVKKNKEGGLEYSSNSSTDCRYID